MQKRILAVAAMTASMFIASSASAINSIDITWRGLGSEVCAASPTQCADLGLGGLTVAPSSTLIADLVLTADAAGVIGVGVTVLYDATEVGYVSGQEFTSVNLPGMGNIMTPLSLGVIDGGDRLNGFDQAPLATGLISGTATLGSFKFHISSGVGDGADIIAAVVPGTADDIIAGGGGVTTAIFNGASVTPEPTTAILPLAGVAGLGYAGRRSIR